LLARYFTAEDGKRIKTADIYTQEEHGINNSSIDSDALSVIARLKKAGFTAYVVGGAVRDLILGKKPKDFDIVTDAYPRSVRQLFRNSRIIGKRFRLVHVFFGDKIFEVATFRSGNEESSKLYGTIEEDVKRRDFSVNALYYSPDTGYLYDYVNGFTDLKKRLLNPVIPVEKIFTEDPVRMIRAVKYASMGSLKICRSLKKRLLPDAKLLKGCSPSRLTEEAFKILSSGCSEKIIFNLKKYGLLASFFPVINKKISSPGAGRKRKIFFKGLAALDARVAEDSERRKSTELEALYSPFMELEKADRSFQDAQFYFREKYFEAKKLIFPITPPNAELEEGLKQLFKERGVQVFRKSGRRKQALFGADHKPKPGIKRSTDEVAKGN
jgi:poly(A) polymerase